MPQEHIFTEIILNCSPSNNTEKDWRFEHAVKAGMVSATLGFPTSVDLRAGNSWYDIGDQVDSGSFVGWGTADSVCCGTLSRLASCLCGQVCLDGC